MAYTIEYFYTSNIGNCRKTNQDNFYCDGKMLDRKSQVTNGILHGSVSCSEKPVFGVFDGMGGEECGEIASYLAASEMKNHDFSAGMEKGFRDFCSNANDRICDKTTELGIHSMGTTAAIMRFTDTESGLCNIGDSKIFLLTEGILSQLSLDHIGIAAYGRKPPLTQNLGIPADELRIDPYIATGTYCHGDIYLLCSDGLTDMVSNERIQQILVNTPFPQAAQMLLQEALDNGGKDNITFILLFVKQKKHFWKEVRLWLQRK